MIRFVSMRVGTKNRIPTQTEHIEIRSAYTIMAILDMLRCELLSNPITKKVKVMKAARGHWMFAVLDCEDA